MSTPEARPALVANVRLISLFETVVGFPFAQRDPPFSGYFGQPLHITKVSIDDNNNVVVWIDDVGPPNASAPAAPEKRPEAIYAMVSIGGSDPLASDLAPLPLKYDFGTLNLAASVGIDHDFKRAMVTPSVCAWVKPNDQKEYLSYVLINTSLGQEMRWFTACVETNHTGSAAPIPPVPGSGVSGPWGVETP